MKSHYINFHIASDFPTPTEEADGNGYGVIAGRGGPSNFAGEENLSVLRRFKAIFIACTNPNPNQNCIYTHAIGAITTPQGGDMF